MGLCEMRGLTFEPRGEPRCGAWPAGRMMTHSGNRAKCQAGASRLQRRVRPQTAAGTTLTSGAELEGKR